VDRQIRETIWDDKIYSIDETQSASQLRNKGERMKQKSKVFIFIVLLILGIYLIGCVSPPPPTTIVPLLTTPPPQPGDTPTQAVPALTFTPTACTGWYCTLDGVVYVGEAVPGNELGGVVVDLSHFSYCSPTMGEHEAVAAEDGTFTFEVYLHDTDSFHFEVELNGYQSWEYSFGGFDCLYCSCPPFEVVLQPEK
jgi:hypothetical protein